MLGCTNLGKLGVETAIINQSIKSGAVKKNLEKIDYTTAEEQVITHALNSVGAFRSRYGEFIDNPNTLLTINTNDLLNDYLELRERFSEVEDIVARNFDRYDLATQNSLTQYSIHAYRLDEAVTSLMSAQKYRESIKNALSYGFATIQLVGALKP